MQKTTSKTTQAYTKGPEEFSGPSLYQQKHQPHCWIELSRNHFNENVNSIKNHIGPKISIAAVLKSNAYGHGLIPIATLCQENHHITYIAVFLLSDALQLRSCGITKPILLLGGYDACIKDAIINKIDLNIYDLEIARLISKKAAELKQLTNIHLKIDSGLARLGFSPREAPEIIEFLNKNPYLNLIGIYSHFAESDAQDLSFTNYQLEQFSWLLTQLKQQNITIPFVHLANTAATLRLPTAHGTMIRCGGLLYGTYKNELFYQQAQTATPNFSIKSILTLKSHIIAIKKVAANTPIGYACSFTTTRQTTIAIVPIGYFDGYDRRLSNNSFMLIDNQLTPVLGRIGMNMTAIDITDVPQAALYSEVIVIGNHDGIKVQDIAKRINAIDYEIFVRLNPNLKRLIV